MAHLHHVHVFASNFAASIAWYVEMLGGEVVYDGEFGGARNVFMRIGSGRLHLCDQPPRGIDRNAVHQIGIRTADLAALVSHLRGRGVALRSHIREFGSWRYMMCAAPDNVLLELFEVDAGAMPSSLARYFDDETGA